MKPACRWIDYDHMSCLQWNCKCIATVKPRNDLFEVMIFWPGREFGGPPCSRAQGKRFIERWVSARSGFPKDREQLEISYTMTRLRPTDRGLVAAQDLHTSSVRGRQGYPPHVGR